ncbi:MAG TPA: glycine oxidase ThiO, partial [Candidatus Limnocylindria bacterium]|nr:glycine oxidase ThiO [Candidatus Limnocylindria bacterium]
LRHPGGGLSRRRHGALPRPARVKIVVVGGGIIGCATAYELAKAGCAVTLFERATPGAEASGAAAGLLAPLGESAETPFEQLAVKSWRLYPGIAEELRERTGIDVEYCTRGTIYPFFTAEDVQAAATRTARPLARELGIEALDAAEVHDREPALAPSVRGAMFVGGDHWVNNQRLVVAYAQAAVAAGVSMRAGSTVTRVVVEDGRARGVIADGERYDGDVVLLAAGAWTGELVASFGARLAMEPKRGQMLALAHVPPVLRHCVHSEEIYLVPRPSGELLVGATVERVGFQRAVTAEGIGRLITAAVALVPALGRLPITRTWFGFRPWVSDSLPVLGPWPGVEGLFVATAHFRNGIMLAPITARLMTNWITGAGPGMEVRDFLPARFFKKTTS